MTLKSPFTGVIFEQMFSEAVETVTRNLLKAYPTISGGKLSNLQDRVSSVMKYTLNAVAFEGEPAYRFGSDNSLLVASVSGGTGIPYNDTETIISEIATSDAVGDIPHWFENPAQAVEQAKVSKQSWDALQPSFIQRVAGTIFSPLGISGGQAILYIQIALAIVVLVAIAYFLRTFKR